jgi:hypothetical protein
MSVRAVKTITIKIPTLDLLSLLQSFFEKIRSFLISFIDNLRARPTSLSVSRRLPFLRNPFKQINFKKLLPALFVVGAAGLTIFVISRLLAKVSSTSSDVTRVSVAGAKATNQLNRDFLFPLKDAKGTTVTEMKFTLENAELRDEIIVKGKRAVAIEGRTFLILTFKITSDYTKSLEINTKNYFRLTKNGNETDLLAADIHNDPVIVQPTSTKYTRIGWPIDDSDQDLVMLVGEIEGEKTKVELGLN